MSPRNKHGFLKATALRAGIPDQIARDVDGYRHVVQIVHDSARGGFVVEHHVTDLGDLSKWEAHEWQTGADLAAARRRFRDIERSL